jgi:hypothetical protein
MFKIFKTLILIIWVIDILNINFTINDIQVAEFLDKTIQINFWAWFLIWLLMPNSCNIKISGGK